MDVAKVKPFVSKPWPRWMDITIGAPVAMMFIGYICVEAAFGYRRESWFRKDVDNGERWFT